MCTRRCVGGKVQPATSGRSMRTVWGCEQEDTSILDREMEYNVR